MAEEVATLARETRSSIELQRAKDGTYYWTIKRYFDQEEADGSSAALEELKWIDSKLRRDYAIELELPA